MRYHIRDDVEKDKTACGLSLYDSGGERDCEVAVIVPREFRKKFGRERKSGYPKDVTCVACWTMSMGVVV